MHRLVRPYLAALAAASLASGGEIWMLDSANYNAGTVTVSKNVNISAIPGQVGSIVAVGGGPAMSLDRGVSARVTVTRSTFSNGTFGAISQVNSNGGERHLDDLGLRGIRQRYCGIRRVLRRRAREPGQQHGAEQRDGYDRHHHRSADLTSAAICDWRAPSRRPLQRREVL